MEEFVFIEPERDISWTQEDLEKEYQNQYERWKRRNGAEHENGHDS